jgi:hypothetical protein
MDSRGRPFSLAREKRFEHNEERAQEAPQKESALIKRGGRKST